MKKYFLNYLVIAALALSAALSGCGDKEDGDPSNANIQVGDKKALKQTVYADDTQGESSITFTTIGAWTSSIKEGATKATGASWLSINPNHGDKAGEYTATIILEPNATGADRSTTITITCEGLSINVSVTQKAKNEDGTAYNPNNPEMVFVQGGSFMMGSLDANINARPQHQVTLSSFSIGKYEITQKQWTAVMSSNPSYDKGDTRPVNGVSWNDIVGTSGASTVINGITYYEDGFIYKFNQLTGRTYRLPTEAEWEYAARGGQQSKGYIYSGSNRCDDVACYYANAPKGVTFCLMISFVGTKAPNELGIYDMSGNAWEWCSDWYNASTYTTTARSNPTGPSSGSERVMRGGGFKNDAKYLNIAYRNKQNPASKYEGDGFRVVLN